MVSHTLEKNSFLTLTVFMWMPPLLAWEILGATEYMLIPVLDISGFRLRIVHLEMFNIVIALKL